MQMALQQESSGMVAVLSDAELQEVNGGIIIPIIIYAAPYAMAYGAAAYGLYSLYSWAS